MNDDASTEAREAAREQLREAVSEDPARGQVVVQAPNRGQRRAAAKAGKPRQQHVAPHQAVNMLAGQVQLLQRQNAELHSSRVQFAEMIGKVVQATRPLIDALDAAFPDVTEMEDKVLAAAIVQCRRVVLGLLPDADKTPEEEAALAADGDHVVVPVPREPPTDG